MTASRIPDRPIDAVLCDVDNVIRFYDTAPLAELERAAGLPEGTTADVAFAPELDLPLLLGKITKEKWVHSIASALTGLVPRAQARELGAALANAPTRCDDAVVDMLRRVRRRVPLVLVTNATLDLERDLESLGLADLADHVVNSARVGVAKPEREIYEIAAERAQAPVQRCLFVDDRIENVEAAVALGMSGVHYLGPAGLRTAVGSLFDG
ncbi:HAD-IA family hydrolase [Streptomyces sp. NBC_01016]|uniref:HAD-IA family hydrolase n=1 Tax=Streptomyces sp. NBC_01016 TaxID=2903720 RepID=UPI00225BD7CC|nr:HAD-IA family hydrolase [Streptomyces sp. NBC_01016]MCX4827594.1 HAD-IA family hydrolase [Streptomyces sp. NBC_01016]